MPARIGIVALLAGSCVVGDLPPRPLGGAPYPSGGMVGGGGTAGAGGTGGAGGGLPDARSAPDLVLDGGVEAGEGDGAPCRPRCEGKACSDPDGCGGTCTASCPMIVSCSDDCTGGGCYRRGVLVTDDAARFCSGGKATPTGLVATSRVQFTLPQAGDTTVWRCADPCPSLAGCEPMGVLTIDPGSCAGRMEDTGLRVAPGDPGDPIAPPGSLLVQACAAICPSAGLCLGYGQLTVDPTLCSSKETNPTGLSVR